MVMLPKPLPDKLVAGEEHFLVCEFCLEPFETMVKRSGKFRDSVEYDQLRRVLMVGPDVEPVFCEACYNTVLGSANSMQWNTHNTTLSLSEAQHGPAQAASAPSK